MPELLLDLGPGGNVEPVNGQGRIEQHELLDSIRMEQSPRNLLSLKNCAVLHVARSTNIPQMRPKHVSALRQLWMS